MKTNNIFAGLTGLMALALSMSAQAYTNTCQNTSGSPSTFNFNFTKQINDPLISPGDTYLADFFSWSYSSSPPRFACDCDPNEPQSEYIWATGTSGLTPTVTVSGKPYYYINEYMDAATKVEFGGGMGSAYVPFQVDAMSSSGTPSMKTYCKNAKNTTLMWGTRGTLSLRVKQPFIGEVVIPPTEVARIYVSWRDQISGTVPPVVRVVLSGIITVPENCEINAGQVINVSFGSVEAGEFNLAGQKPASITPRINSLNYTCQGIYGNKNIAIRFVAEADANYSSAIKTTDSNIGIIIEDNGGTIIPPNSGMIPITLDPINSNGSITIKSYPISTTGNMPALGNYSGMATIRVDFQ